MKLFVLSCYEPEIGEITLAKFSLSLRWCSHFLSLSSRDKKSSERSSSRALPTSLKSCAARAAFKIRPRDYCGVWWWWQLAEDGEIRRAFWVPYLFGWKFDFWGRVFLLKKRGRAPPSKFFWSEETSDSIPNESSKLLLLVLIIFLGSWACLIPIASFVVVIFMSFGAEQP